MGDYDVEIPEDTDSGTYKIRVGRFEDDDLFGCSGAFEIMGAEDSGDNGDSGDNEDDDTDGMDEDDDASGSYTF